MNRFRVSTRKPELCAAVQTMARVCVSTRPPGDQLEGAIGHPHGTVHSPITSALNIFSPNPDTFDPGLVRKMSHTTTTTTNPSRASTGRSRTAMRNVIVPFKPQPAIHVALFWYILFINSVLYLQIFWHRILKPLKPFNLECNFIFLFFLFAYVQLLLISKGSNDSRSLTGVAYFFTASERVVNYCSQGQKNPSKPNPLLKGNLWLSSA